MGGAWHPESRWLPAGEKVVPGSLGGGGAGSLDLNLRNCLGYVSCANHLLSLIQEDNQSFYAKVNMRYSQPTKS